MVPELADSGSLVRYLETFDHTIAVMQTRDQLHRVAAEFVEDLAADGVVYGEARWAPEQHTQRGLTKAEAVEAVRDGLRAGDGELPGRGHEIIVKQLVTSMRHVEPTTEIAELALAYRDDSVAGFDIAGVEDGFPPERFLPAFDLLKQNNAVYTIHAGEAAGLESIWAAVQLCAATRIGHGVRIIDDVSTDADGVADARSAGRLSARLADSARVLPVIERPDRRRRLDRRASHPSPRRPRLSRDGEQRQSADERYDAVTRSSRWSATRSTMASTMYDG